MPSTTDARGTVSLRRELGPWDLTAIGVNQVIGGAVFSLPAAIAVHTGGWSPWMVGAIGIVSMLIALTFAEVASRFDATGGAYLYTKAAFGRFAGFEVGWMLWFTRVASWAAVINVLVSSLGFYWPHMTTGLPRALVITTIIVILAAINIRGIRQSSVVVNVLTIGKLLPLVVFIVAGVWFVNWPRLQPGPLPSAAGLSATGLLLIYAFGGYEIVPVPGGEARNPRRDIPFALVTTIVIVTVVMTLAQVVAFGTLPDLGASKTPLADSAAVFLGAAGAAMITIGAVISVTGASMGGALSGSRNLFALAEQRDLPAFFGYVHPRLRTPVVAILITSSVTLTLALSGTFQSMATTSAVSRLVVYLGACLSTLRLRSRRFDGVVNAPAFVVPLGPLVPVAAIIIALAVLAGASSIQLRNGALALAAGAVLYAIAVRGREQGLRDPGTGRINQDW
ncbi:MAG TPA: APC family permease [Vicinamibacterales bacterium]|nr:APC family permease [Vicinamibacterales bacterium]